MGPQIPGNVKKKKKAKHKSILANLKNTIYTVTNMTIQQLTISGLFLYVRAFNDKLSFPNRMHLVIIIHI